VCASLGPLLCVFESTSRFIPKQSDYSFSISAPASTVNHAIEISNSSFNRTEKANNLRVSGTATARCSLFVHAII